MKPRRLAALVFALFATCAWSQEQAFTNRSTELKDKADGKTVSTLPENTPVKVIARGGGWTQVDANGQKGWVRVFHLRFPATAQTGSSGTGGGFLSSVTGALGGGRQTSQTTIATTGIRGLSPEDLKNANPDTAALAKAQSYRADKPAAERFARDGKLASVKVDEPKGGGR